MQENKVYVTPHVPTKAAFTYVTKFVTVDNFLYVMARLPSHLLLNLCRSKCHLLF